MELLLIRKLPQSHATHPNVTPMIDVVMVMIVFFMLVARIGVDSGADKMIRIPATIRGAEIADMGNTLTLNVQPGPLEQPLITALVKGELRELKLVDPTSRVRQLLVELQHLRYGPDMKLSTDDDNPEFKVIIRADEETPYELLEPVLLACAEANVKNVNFNTRKAEELVPE